MKNDVRAASGEIDPIGNAVRQLADGRITLKAIRGYSNEGLLAIARQAIVLFHQGKREHARTMFQGLMAVDPRNAYFARLAGVAECALENFAGALAAFDMAVKLESEEAASYVGRAEVYVAMGEAPQAIRDLERAAALGGDPRLAAKARAMLAGLKRA